MAVTLKDEGGRLGSPGSIVTVDWATDRFGAIARSADAVLEDRATDAIADRWRDDWPPETPDPTVQAAQFLVNRFGLTIVADTTPDPDDERPSTADDRMIH